MVLAWLWLALHREEQVRCTGSGREVDGVARGLGTPFLQQREASLPAFMNSTQHAGTTWSIPKYPS